MKFDDIVNSVHRDHFMATIDLKAAYRSVMIYPANRPFLGLKWNIDGKSTYLVDNFICFGAEKFWGVLVD